MQRFALKFYYDGSLFEGSQSQLNGKGVEDFVLKALIKAGLVKNRSESKLRFASRTDRGVSALGNVCAFNASKKPILSQLNSYLAGVHFWALARVGDDFNPRRASFREYSYAAPFTGQDVEFLKRQCKLLEGDHDFSSFSNDEVKTTTTLLKASVRKEGEALVFYFKGHHFLRQQIRRMVAYLLECSPRQKPSLKSLLQGGQVLGLKPAPPESLVLLNVSYDAVRFEVEVKEKEKLLEALSARELELELSLKTVTSLKGSLKRE